MGMQSQISVLGLLIALCQYRLLGLLIALFVLPGLPNLKSLSGLLGISSMTGLLALLRATWAWLDCLTGSKSLTVIFNG